MTRREAKRGRAEAGQLSIDLAMDDWCAALSASLTQRRLLCIFRNSSGLLRK